jgi:hypothetical protein
MTTLRTIAAQYDTQVHELAALLDLGTSYDETAQLTDTEAAEIHEIIAA